MRRASIGETKVELQMTPMIDVVFQLLIFFMLTYKPRISETSFLISLPPPTVTAQTKDESSDVPGDTELKLPPIPIRLAADADGKLLRIHLSGRQINGFAELRRNLESTLAIMKRTAGDEDIRVEIAPDERLLYEHIVHAIGAATQAGATRISLGSPRRPEDGAQ